MADFVYITDDAYTAAELKAMEIKILRVIDFDLSRPVSLHFLRRFSKAGDVDVLQVFLSPRICFPPELS